MSERIRELAEQATDKWVGGQFFDREKFAELIVGECIEVLNKRFMGDLNREDQEVRRCIKDLKNHFGVEE